MYRSRLLNNRTYTMSLYNAPNEKRDSGRWGDDCLEGEEMAAAIMS
jgi:hypothetical protein